jgi:hypothetical protein
VTPTCADGGQCLDEVQNQAVVDPYLRTLPHRLVLTDKAGAVRHIAPLHVQALGWAVGAREADPDGRHAPSLAWYFAGGVGPLCRVDDIHFASRIRTVTTSPRRVQPVDSTFDGPLGSFLDVVVRFEDRLSRALAPLARWTGALATHQSDRTAG